ncbi:facilitated trehalose transporter Tret1-like [Drosophila hydei]|uniref:Facilitated trehalose transporter Tret1-like n=1 Tax=Drosophila hydei TaxID=7224 RepID=A0A6J1LHR5_DROHY|nr:facilitated trehalose transporter Tret1-like [Drosophila hydei]
MSVSNSVFVALAASFGGFIVGVSLAWSGPIAVERIVGTTYNFTPNMFHWVFICSIVTLGCAVGCIPAVLLTVEFGRKPIMALMMMPCIFGWLFVLAEQHFSMMLVGRFLIGVGSGGIGVTVNRDDTAKAEAILKWLRDPDVNIQSEVEALRNTQLATKSSFKKEMSGSAAVKGLALAITLMLLRQVTGINAYIFYLKPILTLNGVKTNLEKYLIGFGAAQLITTYVSTFLTERTGRKMWLFVSALIMLIASIIMAIHLQFLVHSDMVWIVIGASILFVVGHSLGFGPLAWFIMSELFSDNVKPLGVAIVSMCSWLFMLLVTIIVPLVLKSSTPSSIFIVFALFSCFACIFVVSYLPETKNKILQPTPAAETSVL